jgi:hypothetical protein
MGGVVIFCQGVLVSGRYGHGKLTKPVTRHFWHYIAFKVTLFPCLHMSKTVKTEWISDKQGKGLFNGSFSICYAM